MHSKSKPTPSAGEGPMDNRDRRNFMGKALGAAAGAGAAAVMATNAGAQTPQAPQPPTGRPPAPNGPPMGPPPGESLRMPGGASGPKLYRVEADIKDVEIEGKIPDDLNGAFYRVGPDPQYPLAPRNIPFDGEGHVSMFRIKDGHVDYKSRFVRNDRYKAQEKAKRILFPIYRNPMHGRSEREGPLAQHRQHAHHHAPELSARAEGRQPAGGDGSPHARDHRPELPLRRPAPEARPSPRTRRSTRKPATWSPSVTRRRASARTT